MAQLLPVWATGILLQATLSLMSIMLVLQSTGQHAGPTHGAKV
jgi:hypothetical protein